MSENEPLVTGNGPSAGALRLVCHGILPAAAMCVFIPSPVMEGSTLFGDHRGSIFSKRAKISQED